nr:ribosomal protein L23 [Apopellia endiviifolia]
MTDRVKYPILTEKTIRLLEKNQYSFDVNVRSNKTEIKKWIELFLNVKVAAVNSHRLPRRKKRIGAIAGYTTCYKRMIIKLQSGYSIPLFSNK